MMDTTRIPGVASDSWWREPQSRVRDMQDEIARVKRGIGPTGFVFSTQSLVIKGDGSIIGEGTGELDWNGEAHFGGNTVIDGQLSIGAGLIGDSALESQLTTDAARDTNPNHVPSTSWQTGASVTLNRPSWATTAVITASGFLYPRISPTAGSPYCLMRIITGTDISPESGMIGGDPPFPISMTWPTKIPNP